MKILLVTQYFHPENFKSNDIAFELVKRGHQVDALVGIPNYPEGKYYKGYNIFKRRIQTVNGVKVFRSFQFPRGKSNKLLLMLNYMSYVFSACFNVLFFFIWKKYDAIIVHATSPIFQAVPAILLRKIKKVPIYLWVLDLWPESLQAAGNINNKYVLGFFSWVTKLMYKYSERILIASRGFRKSILDKGDFEDKIIYFPNWAEDVFAKELVNAFDNQPVLPDGFKLLFAGNIGEAQDFDNVMKAALELKDRKEIKFIIVGDGRRKAWAENFAIESELSDTVFFMGRYPIEMMPWFYSNADCVFLSLKDELIFSLTVPAKLQSYMAAGKPVIAMINGETQSIIEEAKCGVFCNSGDYKTLANIIVDMYNLPKDERLLMGSNGKVYFHKHFSKVKCINHLCEILEVDFASK